MMMKHLRTMVAAVGLVPLCACMHVPDQPRLEAEGAFAASNGAGVTGTARVLVGATGATLALNVRGMSPGTYGAHIHSIGRCALPDFTSAGPHWNPAMRQHGRLNPQGTHAGDLPNLVVAADGAGSLVAPLHGALDGEGGLLDADGAAIVVHAMADDERTDPTGNSGPRILCAVLDRVEPITP